MILRNLYLSYPYGDHRAADNLVPFPKLDLVVVAADNPEEFVGKPVAFVNTPAAAADNPADTAADQTAVPIAPCRHATRISRVIDSTVANNRRSPSTYADSIRTLFARLAPATTARRATNARHGCAYRVNSNRSDYRSPTISSIARRPRRTYAVRSFGTAVALAIFARRTFADSDTRNRPIERFDRLVEDPHIRRRRCTGDPRMKKDELTVFSQT
jgi:hypothetical protein